jgi:hypothetical protein
VAGAAVTHTAVNLNAAVLTFVWGVFSVAAVHTGNVIKISAQSKVFLGGQVALTAVCCAMLWWVVALTGACHP